MGQIVVFSTNYPHPDSNYAHAVDAFLGIDMSDDVKRKHLWDNCVRRQYDLPEN
jgi:predicted TIM-barrel fold metal-dependent hydrolase